MSDSKQGQNLAAVRIRGIIGLRVRVEDTLKMLRLYRKNYCCVIPNNAINVGMLRQAKDYITWGEIDDETFKELVLKRGDEFKGREQDSKKKITYNDFFDFDRETVLLLYEPSKQFISTIEKLILD